MFRTTRSGGESESRKRRGSSGNNGKWWPEQRSTVQCNYLCGRREASIINNTIYLRLSKRKMGHGGRNNIERQIETLARAWSLQEQQGGRMVQDFGQKQKQTGTLSQDGSRSTTSPNNRMVRQCARESRTKHQQNRNSRRQRARATPSVCALPCRFFSDCSPGRYNVDL